MSDFVRLPLEIRLQIYEELLVKSSEIHVYGYLFKGKLTGSARGRDPSFPTSLFRVNKLLHSEATNVLYSRNRFRFLDGLEAFLKEIGPRNASLLRQLAGICFPAPEYMSPKISISEPYGTRFLDLIQEKCPNLETLETSFESTNSIEEQLNKNLRPTEASAFLDLVDVRFKNMQSLKEIVVRAYDIPVNDNIRAKMSSFGWRIVLVKRPDIRPILWRDEEDWYYADDP